MTLENTFYILGIIYIVGSILVLVGIVLALWFLYRKISQTKEELESKIKNEYPVIVTTAVGWAIKSVGEKLFSRKKRS